jgi:hypothetical protein
MFRLSYRFCTALPAIAKRSEISFRSLSYLNLGCGVSRCWGGNTAPKNKSDIFPYGNIMEVWHD